MQKIENNEPLQYLYEHHADLGFNDNNKLELQKNNLKL